MFSGCSGSEFLFLSLHHRPFPNLSQRMNFFILDASLSCWNPTETGVFPLKTFEWLVYCFMLLFISELNTVQRRMGFLINNLVQALMQNATDAMKESRVPDILNLVNNLIIQSIFPTLPSSSSIMHIICPNLLCFFHFSVFIIPNLNFFTSIKILLLCPYQLEPLHYRKLDFEEFCAAAISPYQLEALEGWEHIASIAFEHFERDGNRVISIAELAQVLRSFVLSTIALFTYISFLYIHLNSAEINSAGNESSCNSSFDHA